MDDIKAKVDADRRRAAPAAQARRRDRRGLHRPGDGREPARARPGGRDRGDDRPDHAAAGQGTVHADGELPARPKVSPCTWARPLRRSRRRQRAAQRRAHQRPRSSKTSLVILSAGVRPNTELAVAAGLELGPHGGCRWTRTCAPRDPDIYAAGDVVEVPHTVLRRVVDHPAGRPGQPPGARGRREHLWPRHGVRVHAGHLDRQGVRHGGRRHRGHREAARGRRHPVPARPRAPLGPRRLLPWHRTDGRQAAVLPHRRTDARCPDHRF